MIALSRGDDCAKPLSAAVHHRAWDVGSLVLASSLTRQHLSTRPDTITSGSDFRGSSGLPFARVDDGHRLEADEADDAAHAW